MSDNVLEAPARPELANYVGGEWTPARSGRTYEKRNPANPTEVVGKFPASGEEDVATAVEANLPLAPVNDIVASGKLLFVATDLGVFRSGNGGQLWHRAGQGLPNDANARSCSRALSGEKQQKMTWLTEGAAANASTMVVAATSAARSAGNR